MIIGSGITGAFAARSLLQDYSCNKKVVMLEAREACGGATGRVCAWTDLSDEFYMIILTVPSEWRPLPASRLWHQPSRCCF